MTHFVSNTKITSLDRYSFGRLRFAVKSVIGLTRLLIFHNSPNLWCKNVFRGKLLCKICYKAEYKPKNDSSRNAIKSESSYFRKLEYIGDRLGVQLIATVEIKDKNRELPSGSGPSSDQRLPKKRQFAEEVMSTLEKEHRLAENYYDYIFQDRGYFRSQNGTDEFSQSFISTTVLRSILTILLRVGFLLIQISSVPVGNVNLIVLQNIIDICAVTIVYMLVGFLVAFNGDISGLIGEGVWIGDNKANFNEAAMGWSAAMTASAICTCGIVGRMHTIGYLITAVFISGIIQPFLIHWAWTPQGWMADNNLTGKSVSFKDYAGGGIVHVVGGLAGFLGCMTLGRRILRLRDIDDSSLPPDSPGNIFTGYFLVLLGLQGLSLQIPDHGISNGGVQMTAITLLVNNLVAAASSCLFIVALHFALSREAFNYWTVMRCIQGAISGVVTVAAGLDVYSPLVVIGISCSSGLVFYLVSRRVYRSALEDYCNIVSTHLVCGLFGMFLAPLCGRPRSGVDGANHAMVLDIAWQIICILVLLLAVTLVMWPFFFGLECCGYLRNRSELVNHLRATNALERGPPRSYMQRIFFPDNNSVYLQPGSGTKTSQGPPIMSPRMWRYQEEISTLERQSGTNQSGGANLAETLPDDDDREIVKEVRSPRNHRTKKPRQIHTIRNNNVLEHFDAGGTGDPIETENDLEKSKAVDLGDVKGRLSGDEKNLIAVMKNLESRVSEVKYQGAEHKFRSFEGLRTVEKDQKTVSNCQKNIHTMLHRTQKFVSLHSEELNTKLDHGVEGVRPSDFTVKVLLEPRKRAYASSGSEEELGAGGTINDWQENLDRTV